MGKRTTVRRHKRSRPTGGSTTVSKHVRETTRKVKRTVPSRVDDKLIDETADLMVDARIHAIKLSRAKPGKQFDELIKLERIKKKIERREKRLGAHQRSAIFKRYQQKLKRKGLYV